MYARKGGEEMLAKIAQARKIAKAIRMRKRADELMQSA
jgi:hypothetical protein